MPTLIGGMSNSRSSNLRRTVERARIAPAVPQHCGAVEQASQVVVACGRVLNGPPCNTLRLGSFPLRYEPRQERGNEEKSKQTALPCQAHLFHVALVGPVLILWSDRHESSYCFFTSGKERSSDSVKFTLSPDKKSWLGVQFGETPRKFSSYIACQISLRLTRQPLECFLGGKSRRRPPVRLCRLAEPSQLLLGAVACLPVADFGLLALSHRAAR